MELTKKGLEFIASWEGFESETYSDQGGLPTIGFGHLIRSDEEHLTHGKITMTEALELLYKDVESAVKCVGKYVKMPINTYEADALISFVFNIGCGNFRDSTMCKMLNHYQWSRYETSEQFLRWTKVRHKVTKQLITSPGLLRRRHEEMNMFNGLVFKNNE